MIKNHIKKINLILNDAMNKVQSILLTRDEGQAVK